jgi:hypothetical protein
MKLIVQYSVSLVWVFVTSTLFTSAIVVGAANVPSTRIEINTILKRVRSIFIEAAIDFCCIFIILILGIWIKL